MKDNHKKMLRDTKGNSLMEFAITVGLMAILAVAMTLIYFPLRFFLTLTARSRRLKLLQKIRRLRDELGQPYKNA